MRKVFSGCALMQMMMRLTLTFLLCGASAPLLAAEAPAFDTKAYCRSMGDMAGGSSEMELFCRQSEATAKQTIAGLEASDRAVKHCGELGQASGGSYEMMEFCLREEMAAEQKLNAAPAQAPAAAAAAGLPQFDTQAYCRSLGDAAGGSSEMELFCRQSEETAKNNLAGLSFSERVRNYCTQMGQATGGSYEMMEFCVKEEMAAEQQLQ
ncbi:MAG: hypothetical protein LBV79_09820 [Candidatus Adiutrix sp.]|jgi:hypothetical protein|nr:hypothetical protein [Candidatus Adiutrix sp.]